MAALVSGRVALQWEGTDMRTHSPECPCDDSHERGCVLISTEIGECVSCICGKLERAWSRGFLEGMLEVKDAMYELTITHKDEPFTVRALIQALGEIDALLGDAQ